MIIFDPIKAAKDREECLNTGFFSEKWVRTQNLLLLGKTFLFALVESVAVYFLFRWASKSPSSVAHDIVQWRTPLLALIVIASVQLLAFYYIGNYLRCESPDKERWRFPANARYLIETEGKRVISARYKKSSLYLDLEDANFVVTTVAIPLDDFTTYIRTDITEIVVNLNEKTISFPYQDHKGENQT